MKNIFKKGGDYFPYKIFQDNDENEKNYYNNNSIKIHHKRKRKVALDIYKVLKSVTLSSDIFLNYMDDYNNLTQDYCFKTPKNSVYPLRKNLRYLSLASIQDIQTKSKTNKRPMSAKVYTNAKLDKKKFKLKEKNKNKEKRNIYRKRISLSEKFNKSIDLDNDKYIQKKNFDFIVNYVKNKYYKNNINNNFNESKLKCENILTAENLKYKLSISSICLKFRLINKSNTNENNNDKDNSYKKIYIKFKYLPIFYLLDFQLLKLFISEIIFYEKNFVLNNDKIINQICDKYSKYIMLNINKNNDFIFFKDEFLFALNYKWIVYDIKNIFMVYELSIEMPKIKIKILEKETMIKNNLKKCLLLNLMKNNFDSWDKTVLFELFYIKKFRTIINSLIKPDSVFAYKKINFNNTNSFSEYHNDKIFHFFISDISKKISKYYIFNPYKIILMEKKKIRREMQLNLKESKILLRFKNILGTKNTLLKCVSIENNKNIKINSNIIDDDNYNDDVYKINFNFDILDNISNDYIKIFRKNITENDKKDNQIKIGKIDINLINCSLKRMLININNNKYEEKLFEIPQKFIYLVLNNKNEIINNNSIYQKMEEFCEDILKENEFNVRTHIKKRNLNDENEKNNENGNTIINEVDKKKSLIKSNKRILNFNKSRKNFVINNKKKLENNLNFNWNFISKNNYKNKRRILSAKDLKSQPVKDTLFLTKNISNNVVEDLNISGSESSKAPSIITDNRYSQLYIDKNLNKIKNQKELMKNRQLRNYHLLKRDFNLNKLKKILLNIKRKQDEENIHNKY